MHQQLLAFQDHCIQLFFNGFPNRAPDERRARNDLRLLFLQHCPRLLGERQQAVVLEQKRPGSVFQHIHAAQTRDAKNAFVVGRDPQFYLLGAPDDECILCISRLGHVYVLEDGAGTLLFEHNSLLALAEQARGVLQKKKAQIVARAALVWCAVRETVEEKLDAMVLEGEELLVHCVPQLAALA